MAVHLGWSYSFGVGDTSAPLLTDESDPAMFH